MYKRSLDKSISVSELKHLREEGLTNQQIAERCGCAYSSVHRLIGPQPDSLRKKYEHHKPLPPLTEEPKTPVKSFTQRLEEVLAAEQREKQMTEQILKDIPVAKPEPTAVLVETSFVAPGEVREPENLKVPDAPEVLPAPEITKLPKAVPEAVRDSTLLSDMATLFGLEAVKTYITLRAFELGCKRTFGYYSAETYMDEYRELLEKEAESA
jgi:hypothetical protein